MTNQSLLCVGRAASALTDAQIEELLNEKIENMVLYAHYDLADRKAGWNTDVYNGFKISNQLVDTKLGNKMKLILEGKDWFNNRKLVINAIKTVKGKDYPNYRTFILNPQYAKSGNVDGNIIMYNEKTGLFESHPMGWITVGTFVFNKSAGIYGAYAFMKQMIKSNNFQNTFSQGFAR